MKRFSSILLAATVLGAARAQQDNDAGTQKGSAGAADCLAEFNKVRTQAALDPFTAEATPGNKIPISDSNYIEEICNAMRTASCPDLPSCCLILDLCPSRGGSTADCAAAVSFWKGAHVNFQELPTEYKSDTEGLYAESRNRSLVALFNPNKSATVDCAYVTCPLPTTSTTTASTTVSTTTEEQTTAPGNSGRLISPSSEGQPDAASANLENQGSESAVRPPTLPVTDENETRDEQQAGSSTRRLSASGATVSGLVCLTNPAALEVDKKPFSYVA
ncbi:SAG family member [Eimeria brunetti]|uniref:SAG family member n=1 Tax=Eimeria brunetti TaxID=51314 RepID=U6LSR8_9EIME|nr:SAG family member [Eimeria brunetti]